ncbi:acetylserotonin O-methyltransferase [Dietzia sp. B32]|uniref:acetylserotonin O-methyltransferase n=1 Tax=Dietzia sp. B32 TaxID=2915130 RepID=UPI0021AD7178|nr:acetylserotonin O-methyltransferase [Dietzia sp. B32]UVE94173.1 acetylserotonin O-methyltransferase [Dietzia sp. B32]
MTTALGAIDLLTGYQAAAALTAASRLGIFDLTAGVPATAGQIATALGTDPGGTLSLLDSLVGLGLLERMDSRYAATALSARLGSAGDLRPVAEKEAFFARAWLDLADTVRTGRPRIAAWEERLVTDPDQCRDFLRALVVLATETGPDLAALVEPGARVVDLGGGLGSYAVPLARAGAEVRLIDLPAVAEWAGEELAAAPGITVEAVDLTGPGALAALGPGSADVALVSHLLHDYDDIALRLLRLAREVVREGGTVIVFELPGDPGEGDLEAFGPMFDLMMRVETPGRARRVEELIDLLLAAGFSSVERTGHPLPHAVLLAR